MKKLFCFFLFFSLSAWLMAQREVQTINSDWKFFKGNVQSFPDLSSISHWENISIPHDWNALDVLDDTPGYYRGVGIYKKNLRLNSIHKNKKHYLYFEGANQDAEIYLNGTKTGEHHGGYSAFCIDITSYILWDQDNQLIVKLSNAEDANWLPLSGDLNHFGGIYRDVFLIKTNELHFDMNNVASSGVFINTIGVKSYKPQLMVNGAIENDTKVDKKITLSHILSDAKGYKIAEIKQTITLKSLAKTEFKLTSDVLKGIKLWSPEHPNLYTLSSQIKDDKGILMDEVMNPVGFRYFSMDKDSGFYLNGKHCFIKGIGRQQDYDKMGFAVSNEIQINDVKMIKEMGCNFLRAHYPQDPSVWNECDKLGIMLTGRIPLFDKITYTQEFTENTKQMMKEMMLQHYNNPSVVMWEYMNEIFGGMDWYWPKPQDPAMMKKEKEEVYKLAVVLEKYVRELDPERLTEQVFHTDPNPIWYKETGLTDISKVNGWNIYFGWYHGNLQLVGKAIDEFRAYNPSLPYLIAEYGAGSDRRIHTDDPTPFDFSTEYQEMFQKVYLQEVAKRSWIGGMCMWTWCDFQADGRGDVMPHINNKGMVTADRKIKDSYYLYKSRWNPEPMIHIAGKDWKERKAITSGEPFFAKKVTIYSNLKEVEMMLNGVPMGKKAVQNFEAVFMIPFKQGMNVLEARGIDQDIRDVTIINYEFQNLILDDTFREICVNAGQSRTYFYDPTNKDQWLPDREYLKGGWGHKDGDYYRIWNDMKAWQGIREGVGDNVKETSIDPVFQTFLVGIKEYQFDVPNGEYEVELYFAEPFKKERRMKTEEKTGADSNGDRIFDVMINSLTVMKDFNLADQYGELMAVKESFDTKVFNGKGISIMFKPLKGLAVINGIRIRRK